MAQSFKFYTNPNMRKAVVHAITSEATGRDAEFALDYNLDTYWEPTSTANQNFDINLGSDLDVEGFVIFLRNYNAGYGIDTVDLQKSNDGSSWSSLSIPKGLLNVNQFGVLIGDAGSTHTEQYWRFAFTSLGVKPQVASILLFTKYSIATGSLYPEQNDKNYAIKKQMGPGGRTLKRQLNRIAIETFGRTWLLSGDVDRDKLEAMWDDTRGHALPLVMQEDSDDERFVEIIQPQAFNANKIQHQLYRPTITFRTLPYIEDGENF